MPPHKKTRYSTAKADQAVSKPLPNTQKKPQIDTDSPSTVARPPRRRLLKKVHYDHISGKKRSYDESLSSDDERDDFDNPAIDQSSKPSTGGPISLKSFAEKNKQKVELQKKAPKSPAYTGHAPSTLASASAKDASSTSSIVSKGKAASKLQRKTGKSSKNKKEHPLFVQQDEASDLEESSDQADPDFDPNAEVMNFDYVEPPPPPITSDEWKINFDESNYSISGTIVPHDVFDIQAQEIALAKKFKENGKDHRRAPERKKTFESWKHAGNQPSRFTSKMEDKSKASHDLLEINTQRQAGRYDLSKLKLGVQDRPAAGGWQPVMKSWFKTAGIEQQDKVIVAWRARIQEVYAVALAHPDYCIVMYHKNREWRIHNDQSVYPIFKFQAEIRPLPSHLTASKKQKKASKKIKTTTKSSEDVVSSARTQHHFKITEAVVISEAYKNVLGAKDTQGDVFAKKRRR